MSCFRNSFGYSGTPWNEKEQSQETITDFPQNAENVSYNQVMHFMTWVKDRIDSSSFGLSQWFLFERIPDGILGPLTISIKVDKEPINSSKYETFKFFIK